MGYQQEAVSLLKRYKYLIGLLAIVLSGCGSSGTESSTPAGTELSTLPLPSIQGLYQGTLPTGKAVDALILEDGSLYEIYGVASDVALVAQGVVIGTITAVNNDKIDNLKILANDYPAPGTAVFYESGSATVIGPSLTGTLTEGPTSTNFTFTVPVATTYKYDTPANLSSITGSWRGALLNGDSTNVIILADGTLTATSLPGCSATGIVAPRPSGKNVFNFSLTYGAAPCAQPNQTVSGISLTYTLSNGTNQLVAILVDSSRTTANAFFAVR